MYARLSKSHLIGQNASSATRLVFLPSQPRNTNCLMCHQRNLHSWQWVEYVLQTEALECVVNTAVLVEDLCVPSGDDKLVDTA